MLLKKWFHILPSMVVFLGVTAIFLSVTGQRTVAQTLSDLAGLEERPHLSIYGTPGVIEMPSGFSLPDGDFAVTVAGFGPVTRGTLAFQIAPRLTGVFRYQRLQDFFGSTEENPDLFDRSFEILYKLADEGRYRPALTVGIRDFGGTGIVQSEYLVASKTLSPVLKDPSDLGGAG